MIGHLLRSAKKKQKKKVLKTRSESVLSKLSQNLSELEDESDGDERSSRKSDTNMELKVRLARLRSVDMPCKKSNVFEKNETETGKNSTPISSAPSTPNSNKNQNTETLGGFSSSSNYTSTVASPKENESPRKVLSFSLINSRKAGKNVEKPAKVYLSDASGTPPGDNSQKVNESPRKVLSPTLSPNHNAGKDVEEPADATVPALSDESPRISPKKVNNSPKKVLPPSVITRKCIQTPTNSSLAKLDNNTSKTKVSSALEYDQNLSPNESEQENLSSSSDSDANTKKTKKRKSHSVEEYRNKGEVKELVQQSLHYYEKGDGMKDRKKRYKKTDDDLIYLGEGLAVPLVEWLGMQTIGPKSFIGELISMFWSSKDLAKRALNLDKVSTKVKGSPIKTIEGPLLRLLISVYCDYLSEQSDIPCANKVNYLYSVTDISSKKIRNCRQNYLENVRQEERRERKERKKVEAKKRLKF